MKRRYSKRLSEVSDASAEASPKEEGSQLMTDDPEFRSGRDNECQRSSFCKRCQRINFDKIFSTLSKEIDRESGKVVTAYREDSERDCPLCDLILSLLRDSTSSSANPGATKHGYHLRAIDSTMVLRAPRRPKRFTSQRNVVLTVVNGSPKDEIILSQPEDWINPSLNGFITLTHPYDALEVPKLDSRTGFEYFGRRVQSDRIDFGLLRDWIRECTNSNDNSHEPCNLKNTHKDAVITRVIDCDTRKVVPLTKHMSYLALSYVWGSRQVNSASGDFVSAPATIKDAMQVVQELGERYLWVDRYCIKEDDTKHLQIQNMGLIYERALATIVAVTAVDSETGLPGVSAARVMHQPSVTIRKSDIRFYMPNQRGGHLTLISTMRHLSRHTTESKWATRGWTYQEAFLSRRCLFFTDEQVFFACRTTTQCESVVHSPVKSSDGSTEKLGPNLISNQRWRRSSSPNSNRPIIHAHLQEYTRRELTYESDGLNAFKGILANQMYPSYFGVTLIRSQTGNSDLQLCQGLLWTPSQPRTARRCKMFPSWSWASISGPISYDYTSVYHKQSRSRDEPRPDRFGHACVEVEDKNSRRVKIGALVAAAKKAATVVIPEMSSFLYLRAPVGRFRLISTDDDADHLNFALWAGQIRAEEPVGYVDLDVVASEELRARLLGEEWDVMFLLCPEFSLKDESVRFLKPSSYGYTSRGCQGLLLNWRDCTAYRIGYAYLRLENSGVEAASLQMRSIRLG